ncbi:MAG: arylsulfatase, partial [Kordiimonadaceae bacterium]|nr:arylsulfatase [Kordiimonadaceae bacterium]
ARDYIIEESVVTLSLRKGNWKYIAPTSPQGNERAQWVAIDKAIEGGFTAQAQLYNLAEDPTEQNNIANDHPELVQEMSQKLAELRISGFRN